MKIRHIIILIALAITLPSCSLLKFSIDTGDVPLTKEEQKIRMMTRGFYNTFNFSVISISDSIINSTDDINIKLRATRWKLSATSAATAAVYQSVTEVALLNIWSLCKGMSVSLANTPDSLLFKEYTPMAVDCSEGLLLEIDSLASGILPSSKYKLMHSFINDHKSSNNISDTEITSEGLMLEWVKFVQSNGEDLNQSIGSISEVMSDLTDRMSGYSVQYGNEIDWSKDLFTLKMKQDSIDIKLMTQLDSLTSNFNKITLILEHSPELINVIGTDLNGQFAEMIITMNTSINTLFLNIDNQRSEVQTFIADQRKTLVSELHETVKINVDNIISQLPGLIGEILIYLIIFIVVLFSIPFMLGFIIGKSVGVRKVKKRLKKESENKTIE